MLTRKHPHARDLLRRTRKEPRFRPTTPISIMRVAVVIADEIMGQGARKKMSARARGWGSKEVVLSSKLTKKRPWLRQPAAWDGAEEVEADQDLACAA